MILKALTSWHLLARGATHRTSAPTNREVRAKLAQLRASLGRPKIRDLTADVLIYAALRCTGSPPSPAWNSLVEEVLKIESERHEEDSIVLARRARQARGTESD